MPPPTAGSPARPAAADRRRAVGSLLALYGTAMLFRAAQNDAQTTIAPIGQADAHLRTALIGAVLAASGAISVAVTVLCGRRARESSVHRWLRSGLVLTAASLPVLAAARSWPVLLAGAGLLGAGGGLTFPSLASMVGHHPSSAAQRRLAGFALALSISLCLGPVLDSGVLALTRDSLTRSLLFFTVLPVLSLLLVRAPAGRRPGGPDGGLGAGIIAGTDPALPETVDPVPEVPAAAGPTAPGPAPTDPAPWQQRPWRLATAAQLLYQVPFVAVISFGVLAGEHLDGVRLPEAQLGISAFFALSMLTRAAVTTRHRVEHPRTAILVVAVLTLAGLVLLASGRSALWLFVALAILGLPHGLVYPVALGLIAEGTPPHLLVRANAAFSACTSAVSAFLPAVLGAVAAAAGLRVMYLTLLAPTAAIGLLVAFWSGLRLTPAR